MDTTTEGEEGTTPNGAVVARALAWFWGAFVAMNTARAALLGYRHPIASLERRLEVALIGVGLSWAIYRLLVRWRPVSVRASVLLTSAMSLPAALVFSTSNFIIFDMLTPIPGEGCENNQPCTFHDLVVSVSDMLIYWSFIFIAWGMLYLSLAAAAQARAADQRAATHLEAARLAQIRALRYQVNPHFLFNVLNSLTALVSRRETAEAELLIGEIGTFLRQGLSTDPVADTILEDEIEMQRRYLDLERRRFPQRLLVEIDVAPEAADAAVPPLILQPLIENAVKHGIGRTGQPVTIAIRAKVLPDGRLCLTVQDDAPTAFVGEPAPDGLGVGQRNVSDRLEARYGAGAAFAAGPLADGGYRATLVLPLVGA